jgi:crossover junction endodeoxyribonuclease RusA
VISFIVYGAPVPQGSKNPWGGEANPKTRPWRAAVSAAAADAMDGQALLAGPVELTVEFVFPRPKSHFGTGRNAGVLKDTAPEYVTKAPDLDKLTRAIGDALTGVVFRDDAQVADLSVRKVYGEPTRALIEVVPLAVSRLVQRAAA